MIDLNSSNSTNNLASQQQPRLGDGVSTDPNVLANTILQQQQNASPTDSRDQPIIITRSFRPDPAVTAKYLEERRVIQLAADQIIKKVEADPKFQADRKGYVETWKKTQLDETNRATSELDDPNDCALFFFEQQDREREIQAQTEQWIERVENDPEYQTDPKTYLLAWIKRRGSDPRCRVPDDQVLEHFKKIYRENHHRQQNQGGCVIT